MTGTDPGRTARSSLVRTAGLGLTGAALLAVACSQTWVTASVSSPAARSAVAKGTEVAPVALPLALVALAAWGSVLVLRRRGRRVVAVLGLLSSLGALVAVIASFGGRAAVARDALGGAQDATVSTSAWPVLACLGAALAAAAFAVAVRRAATWPEMSRRYDAPAGAGAASEPGTSDRDLWRALDEGRDPTA